MTHGDLVKQVQDINCTQPPENLNTTDIENRNIAEAKPFLKVLYIATQLFIYVMTASCFGVAAQLRKRRANVHIASLPRSGSWWTRKGWKELSSNNNHILKKIVQGSLRQKEFDPLLRARLHTSKHRGKLERVGCSAGGISFRQQVARSHLKLEKILCQVIEPKEAGTYLREYLISAVDRLTQVNLGALTNLACTFILRATCAIGRELHLRNAS